MQPVKITVKDGIGREVTDKGTKWGTFSGPYLEDYKDAGYPCPELSNTKPSETVEAELVWQERRFGEEWDNIDAPTNESQWTRQIYRLVPKEGKDRTPSPSGGIRSAEDVLAEMMEAMPYKLPIKSLAYIIEAIHAYHNQFAGDGWKDIDKDGLPKIQGDESEYLCRGIKSTHRNLPDAEKRSEYVVCWFDNNKFHVSWDGKVYEDNNDLMFLTHYKLISPPQNTKESL